MGSGDPPITLKEQSWFIIQGAALALAAGAERAEVYKLYDNDVGENYEAWGLVRADGTRRPGYYALQTANRYFNDTIKAERFTTMSAVLVTLQQPDQTVYVMWNRSQSPLYARIKTAGKTGADAVTVSVTGQVGAAPVEDRAGGSYELLLPPCNEPCLVEGEPRILIRKGIPQTVWIVKEKEVVKIN